MTITDGNCNPSDSITCSYRVRYRQVLSTSKVSIVEEHGHQCKICMISYHHNNNLFVVLHIDFIIPQRAVTLGQTVALYDHDVCLGGGKCMIFHFTTIPK